MAAPNHDVDLHEAWRMAYIASGDQALASQATTRAYAQLTLAEPGAAPSRQDLLATTLRLSLRAAAESPGAAPGAVRGSAVTTALWQLPSNQRAALWLTQVNDLGDAELGAVLGLSPANAEHIAERAAGWLDVALDHGSGPLCQHEAKLRDYLDGKLPMVEAAEIDDHLPSCPTCKSKVNAYEELTDLPAVLRRAVPDVPGTITVDSVASQAPDLPPLDFELTVVGTGRPPALRPLALCCAALLVLGGIGAGIVRPAHRTTDPVTTSDAPPGVSPVVPNGGSPAGAATDSVAPAATAATTTTTLQPAVTFPTVPAGGSPRGTPRR